ncbi:uncharacterized protein AB675_2237 [Cyphellophora attinorum]|uniref:SGNH hydrolase-type esterase domain-containing protein n=1 Tax=Cyphellophora attinorum TaxID=1664694 RepID=A0A0N1H3B5_9EURO|nr:uncharacterized protein AB675_2237 [Phialophora attinorum]KPI34862.1 hypothetical protein AB675_2237 [Phialophora attinorum]
MVATYGWDRWLSLVLAIAVSLSTLSSSAASAAVLSASASDRSTAEQEPIVHPSFRAMIVGDSMSQGKDGQYTWRYRFWQYLRSSVSVVTPQFVGPFNGTFLDDHNPNTVFHMKGKYAAGVDPEFLAGSCAHASAWGRPLSWSELTIAGWVKVHQPDWVLLMMGFNDLSWMGAAADELMEHFENDCPAPELAKSVTREHLVNVTEQYNRRLIGNITRIEHKGEPSSMIKLVHLNRVYGCQPDYCPDGWDGLHPNEDGEWDIARAFSIAMVEMGLTEKAIGNCLID